MHLHPALLFAARTAALTQQSIDEHNQAAVMRAFADEIAALHAHLTTLMAYPAQSLARADPLASNVRSVRMLQKRFMALVYLENVRTLSKTFPTDCSLASHAWICNQATDEAGSPYRHPGMGAWLTCCPTSGATAVDDCAFRWGWRMRLGIAPADLPATCSGITAQGRACSAAIDACGVHFGTCSRQMQVQRHNAVRKLVAQLCRSAGHTVLEEQRVGWHTAEEGPKGTHTADISSMDADGRSILVDIRTMTCPAGETLAHALLRHEKAKRAEYGLEQQSPVDAHWDDVRAYVIESHGRLGPTAVALTTYLLQLAAKRRMNAMHQPWGVALQQERSLFFDKLSVVLLRNAWSAYRRCAGSSTANLEGGHAPLPAPASSLPLQAGDDSQEAPMLDPDVRVSDAAAATPPLELQASVDALGSCSNSEKCLGRCIGADAGS